MWFSPFLLPAICCQQAIASGTLPVPPIGASLAYKLAEVTERQAIFTIEPAEFHYNPIGMVHGGVAATLLLV